MGIYHLGAAECLVKHGGKVLQNVQHFAGASAGALVSAVMLLSRDHLKDYTEFSYALADEVRAKPMGAFSPGYDVMDPVENKLREYLPPNAHELATSKLYISLTDVTSKLQPKNYLVSKFDSNEYLIKCLLASCHIPLYTKRKACTIDGKRWIDGGFTDNLPTTESKNETLLISAFSSKHNIANCIAPKDKKGLNLHVTFANQTFKINNKNITRGFYTIFPPDRRTLRKFYQMGFHDTGYFLKKHSLYSDPS